MFVHVAFVLVLAQLCVVDVRGQQVDVFADNGDIVLQPAANHSVVVEGDLMMHGQRVATDTVFSEALSSLTDRIAALETSLAGACVSSPCLNGATCQPEADAAFVCVCAAGYSGVSCDWDLTAFVSVWRTTGASESISLPLFKTGSYEYAFVVDWGDATAAEEITLNTATHTYAEAGSYTVVITGTLRGFRFNGGSASKLYEIKQWGALDLGYHAAGGYFNGCSNLVVTATDAPDLSTATVLDNMFRGTMIDTRGSFTSWDTSRVTSMLGMFYACVDFNQPLSFDTSQVTDMSLMFANCQSFNQPISFNTSSVTTMRLMFLDCSVFNQPIQFDTSRVESMHEMFKLATAFDHPLTFNTGANMDFGWMFSGCQSLNSALTFSDTSGPWLTIYLVFLLSRSMVKRATTMSFMFYDCNSFNQPLNFDTKAVVSMTSMFSRASVFNQDLSEWCVSLISAKPSDFDSFAPMWTAPRPNWGFGCD